MTSRMASLRPTGARSSFRAINASPHPWAGGTAQLGSRVVVEAQVDGRESFLQNTLACEQAQGGPLPPIRRPNQHFAVPFKIGPGNAARDALREGDGAIVKKEVDVVAIDGGIANFVNLLRIEADLRSSR